MASLNACIFCCFVVCFVGNLFLFYCVSLNFEYRAIVFRAQFVMTLEFLILIGVRIAWKHVTRLIDFVCGYNQNLASARHDFLHLGLKCLLGTFLSLAQISHLTNIVLIYTEPHWITFAAYVCLGIFVHFIFCILMISLFSRLVRFFSKTASGKKNGNPRGTEITTKDIHVSTSRHIKTVISMVYAIIVGILGLHSALQTPEIKFINVPIKGLPSSLDGFRFVQISDIHLGPTVGKSRLESVVEIVNSLHAGTIWGTIVFGI